MWRILTSFQNPFCIFGIATVPTAEAVKRGAGHCRRVKVVGLYMKILIIEDEASLRELIERELRGEGYVVETP